MARSKRFILSSIADVIDVVLSFAAGWGGQERMPRSSSLKQHFEESMFQLPRCQSSLLSGRALHSACP
ncbi:hypothetical protein MRX96_030480 [Rhipicephalus microplus]